MIKFLDLYKQYLSIKDEIDSVVESVIRDSAFIGGKYLKKFEENFAKYQQTKYCVGVGNGTDALEISIEALNIKKGSEIIVPANSFIASAEAITRSGCKIVFCDINADDYTINLEDLNNKITSSTSAIIAVHIYGHPCDMDALLVAANKYNLKIIEDCAQAHGSEYKGEKVGAIGDIGCFSFYPTKIITSGEGGMVTTNNSSINKRINLLKSHALSTLPAQREAKASL